MLLLSNFINFDNFVKIHTFWTYFDLLGFIRIRLGHMMSLSSNPPMGGQNLQQELHILKNLKKLGIFFLMKLVVKNSIGISSKSSGGFLS